MNYKKLFLSLIALSTLLLPTLTNAQTYEDQPTPVPDTYYTGVVREILEESTNKLPTGEQLIQRVRAEVKEDGEITSRELPYEVELKNGIGVKLNVGDKIVVGKMISVYDDSVTYYISDRYRLTGLWWLAGIFAVFVIVLTRFAGVRSLLSIVLSLFVIVKFLMPQILSGNHVLVVGLVTMILLAAFSLFFAHGFSKKIIIAFVGSLITIVISLLITIYSIGALHLFGIGSEDAFFLLSSGYSINLSEILIIGIIISVLGVLDDVTTGQVSIIAELKKANPSYTFSHLFTSGFNVGRTHIISLVNTLVLVYVGSSLPLLLLFNIYTRPVWLTINSEIFMEEIVRILLGSIALLCAIPITTAIAAWWYGKKERGD